MFTGRQIITINCHKSILMAAIIRLLLGSLLALVAVNVLNAKSTMFMIDQRDQVYEVVITDPDTSATSSATPQPEIGSRVVNEISQLAESLEHRLGDMEILLSDRIGAVDQRLAGVERRTNETFMQINSFENQFWYIIIALLFLSLVTVLSILVLTFKFIEPMKKENKMLNESFVRLQAEIPKNSENIHQALRDLAKDDPYIAQILKKNKLL